MRRLEGKNKNILFIIPKDYYDEEQFENTYFPLKEEGATCMIASCKLKEAVGMKTGRQMPDVLVVDAMEGITGDSYVTSGRGTRQIKGVYHGVILIGGSGARQYLWNDKLTRLLITDRYRSGFILGAFGSATPTITNAGLADDVEIAAEDNKKTRTELEKSKAVISSEPFVNDARILTARSGENAKEFVDAFIEAIAKTALK
jgi:protease I